MTNDSRLGAPLYWAWILTGLQVAALWAAGCRKGWAWLLGAGVQPVWITYALLTGQLGFVPGCLVSIAVQVRNFLQSGSDPSESPGSSDPLLHPVGGTAGLEHIGYACTHRR